MTLAFIPCAINAALKPTTPHPIITTFAGGAPVAPDKSTPLPLFVISNDLAPA